MSEVLELARSLIRFDTADPPGGELEIARFVADRLAADGLDVELDEFEPGRANVFGRLEGRGSKPALVFSAHFDTMPPGAGAWRHGPYEAAVEDGRLYGRGASDMKSGMAAMIVAAAVLAREGNALGGDLVLAFSAGESSSCLGARRMVERGDLAGAGALLVSEPSSMAPLIAERGALWLEAIAEGRSGHASAGDGAAVNAVERMVDGLARLKAAPPDGPDHPLLGHPSLAVGTIEGGTVVNLTPDRCRAHLDLRTVPGQSPEDVEAAVAATLGEGFTVSRLDHKPPVETAADHPFVACCLDALAGNGPRPEPAGVSYYSDACVLSPAFDLPMVIIGPGELGMSGQTDEWCAVERLEQAVPAFAEIARRWLAA